MPKYCTVTAEYGRDPQRGFFEWLFSRPQPRPSRWDSARGGREPRTHRESRGVQR